jgi:DNA-binding HxlR family transcriptional regulator
MPDTPRTALSPSHRNRNAKPLMCGLLCLEIFRRLYPYAPAVRVLLFLEIAMSGGPVPFRELQNALHLSASRLSRNLHALNGSNLIRLHDDPSNRTRKQATLSQDGLWLFGQIQRVAKQPREFDSIRSMFPEYSRPPRRLPRPRR